MRMLVLLCGGGWLAAVLREAVICAVRSGGLCVRGGLSHNGGSVNREALHRSYRLAPNAEIEFERLLEFAVICR
jgi:hypothetical protein